MRNFIKIGLFLMILVSHFNTAASAFIEGGRLVTPANIDSARFEIKITPPGAGTDGYLVEIIGVESEVADIRNEIYVFQADKFSMSEKFEPLYDPRNLYPDGKIFSRNFIAAAKDGRRKWRAEFTVSEEQIKNTYFAVYPPINVSDGTTYVFDLPEFFRQSLAK